MKGIVCTACPTGSSGSKIGSTAVSACVCKIGYHGTKCGAPCTACASGTATYAIASTAGMQQQATGAAAHRGQGHTRGGSSRSQPALMALDEDGDGIKEVSDWLTQGRNSTTVAAITLMAVSRVEAMLILTLKLGPIDVGCPVPRRFYELITRSWAWTSRRSLSPSRRPRSWTNGRRSRSTA